MSARALHPRPEVVVLDGGTRALVVFLPGFLVPADAYRALLTPCADAGATVVVPQLYRRGPVALLGGVPVAREAGAAADLVRRVTRDRGGMRLVLGGHSRGGQAAWRAAGVLAAGPGPAPDALVLVDPVDGEGRHASTPTTTASPSPWHGPTLVIGAGLGGRCAPAAVNHAVFAAAAPWARHVVVAELGHADVLDGRVRALGRRLCPGGPHPDASRAGCAALVAEVALG